MIKSRWEGISGGRAIDDAVAEFFASLDAAARRELGARGRGPAAGGRVPGDDHAGVRRARRRGRRGRGRAHAALPARCLGADRTRDLHDRADGADQRRAGAARSTTRPRASGSSTSSASPSAGRRRRIRSSGRSATTLVPSFTGAGDVHAARAGHVRPRDRRGPLLRQPARRRGATRVPLQRVDPAARRRRARPGRLGAVVVHHDVAHADRDLARDDATPLSRAAAGSHCRRTRSSG